MAAECGSKMTSSGPRGARVGCLSDVLLRSHILDGLSFLNKSITIMEIPGLVFGFHFDLVLFWNEVCLLIVLL